MDFAVTEVGRGDALVVFVHGALDRGSSFDRIAERLVSECRMFWYDRRGYGVTAGAEAPVGIDDHVTDLVALLQTTGPAVVVGHSFGGIIAIGAAVRAPGLVDALVLYESGIAWAPRWDDAVMKAVLSADNAPDAGLRLMLGDRYDAMSESERARRLVDALAFVAEERSVRTGGPPYEVSEIRAPIVFGTSSPQVMPMVIDYLQREVPHVEIVTLPGAAHHAHRTAPDEFAGLVRRGVQLARR